MSQVIELVKKIQMSKYRAQDLANRIAKWLTIIALSAGALTFVSWIILGFDVVLVLERTVAVMIIACPHALRLAIPLVIACSTAISASNGILIRNRMAFERAKDIQAVVFDKTGTLTKGELGVDQVVVLDNNFTSDKVVHIAATLEQYSGHPIAKGIIEYAKKNNTNIGKAREFKALPGVGIEGVVNGLRVKVVSSSYVKEKNIPIAESVEELLKKGKTVVFALIDGKLIDAIALSDIIRDESREAVKILKKMGIKTIMLTGDNRQVAKYVAEKLGIDEFYAEVLPHEKAKVVKRVREKGYITAMVGDGINDAPASMEANVGIAIGASTDIATDIAIESADIILVKNYPKNVPKAIELSRRTYNKIKQNLIWATRYNAFAIPAVAGVLYSIGFLLPPALGAMFMSLSTVIVAVNASLLK